MIRVELNGSPALGSHWFIFESNLSLMAIIPFERSLNKSGTLDCEIWVVLSGSSLSNRVFVPQTKEALKTPNATPNRMPANSRGQ